MKTAMKQLLEWHRKSMRSYSETNKMIEALLEKEKEQIMRDFKNGYKSHPVMCEEYYNQTYNQNK